jgi:hypothetical protein
MANRKVPELFVEQLRLGEATKERAAALQAEAGADEVARRVDDLARSDGEILARYPPQEMAARIRERAASSAGESAARSELHIAPPSRRRISLAARIGMPLAAAAAVTLAVAFLPRLLSLAPAPAAAVSEGVRVKGTPELLVYRKGSAGAELLADRGLVKPGDWLQIKYVPAGRSYGAIVSIDGRGAVTLHFPESPSGSTRLEGDKAAALEHAFELDDAPGFERFFFVTSRQGFAAAVVVAAAERLAKAGARAGSLGLPEGFEQTSELFVKGE